MRRPTEEMTRGNQTSQQQQVPFVTISRHEKLGEVLYEERVYPPGAKHLQRFYETHALHLQGEFNSTCCECDYDGINFMKDVLTAYYLPAELQTRPPEPADPDIRIVHRDETRVIARVFYGTTTEETISRQISILWELLGSSEDVLRDRYMVAVYENPGVPQHRHEICFVHRGS